MCSSLLHDCDVPVHLGLTPCPHALASAGQAVQALRVDRRGAAPPLARISAGPDRQAGSARGAQDARRVCRRLQRPPPRRRHRAAARRHLRLRPGAATRVTHVAYVAHVTLTLLALHAPQILGTDVTYVTSVTHVTSVTYVTADPRDGHYTRCMIITRLLLIVTDPRDGLHLGGVDDHRRGASQAGPRGPAARAAGAAAAPQVQRFERGAARAAREGDLAVISERLGGDLALISPRDLRRMPA